MRWADGKMFRPVPDHARWTKRNQKDCRRISGWEPVPLQQQTSWIRLVRGGISPCRTFTRVESFNRKAFSKRFNQSGFRNRNPCRRNKHACALNSNFRCFKKNRLRPQNADPKRIFADVRPCWQKGDGWDRLCYGCGHSFSVARRSCRACYKWCKSVRKPIHADVFNGFEPATKV